MKTPKQWMDIFLAQDTDYGKPTAEANIQAIQDEAFKAGMIRAVEIAKRLNEVMPQFDALAFILDEANKIQ